MTIQEERIQLDQLYRQLNDKVYDLYTFVEKYSEFMHAPKDYDTGEAIGTIDVHTLTYIEQNPGTTITALAKDWKKTKSAVSQTVRRLVENGYVERVRQENNAKTVYLYPTEKGIAMSTAHKLYDIADITQTHQALLKSCTEAEIDVFFKVVAAYARLLVEED